MSHAGLCRHCMGEVEGDQVSGSSPAAAALELSEDRWPVAHSPAAPDIPGMLAPLVQAA